MPPVDAGPQTAAAPMPQAAALASQADASAAQSGAVPDGAVQARPSLPGQGTAVDRYRAAFVDYTRHHGAFPDGDQLATWLFEQHGITGRSGDTLSAGHLRRYLPGFREEWEAHQRAAVGAGGA